MKPTDRESTMLDVSNFSLNDFTQLIKSRQVVAAAIAASCLAISAPSLYAERLPTVQGQQAQNTEINPTLMRPKIQVAILLDTSGSMDGLIDQTRNQLWQVVNEFSSSKKNGVTPILEVALFEYGNNGNSKITGYTRKLNGFTRELDRVSEGLFSLTTNGGNEYCGMAIKTAVNGLQWSHSNEGIKSIFIAGNEPFTQGPVNYQHAVRLAAQRGITVNTIHAGGHQQGIDDSWKMGASLAGGDYMSIDANQKVVHVTAPQDKKIAELNAQLNNTYIPYGKRGASSAERQIEQDEHSHNISASLLAKRTKAKSTSFYNNADWDLVDAIKEGKVNDEALARIEETTLPEPMVGMSAKEKKDYVKAKSKARQIIKQEISSLSTERSRYVAEQKRKLTAAAPSMSDALVKSIKKQAEAKAFQVE